MEQIVRIKESNEINRLADITRESIEFSLNNIRDLASRQEGKSGNCIGNLI